MILIQKYDYSILPVNFSMIKTRSAICDILANKTW